MYKFICKLLVVLFAGLACWLVWNVVSPTSAASKSTASTTIYLPYISKPQANRLVVFEAFMNPA